MPLHWYAVHVKSHCEARVHQDLGARGMETFLPLHRSKRSWSDRKKVIEIPVFPGYLFVYIDLEDRLHVLNTHGVAHIVGAGSIPLPIDDVEMDAVRTLVASNILLLPWPYLRVGQIVRIDRGPLAGLEGMIARAPDGSERVVVSVSLLQRSIAAEIDRDWIGGVSEAARG